jgi:hypothetical protein
MYNWLDVGLYHHTMGFRRPGTVLVPLVLGFVGLVIFMAYGATHVMHPLVRAFRCDLI